MKVRKIVVSVLLVLLLLTSINVVTFAKEEPHKLTLWGWSQTIDHYKAEVEPFKKAYPEYADVKFEFVELPWLELHTKLLTAIASGVGAPDITIVEGAFSNKYAGKGLIDLTEKLDPYRDKVIRGKWGEGFRDDRQYGVPFDCGPAGIYYRSDIFEEAGITENNLPETWDEFREIGRKLTRDGRYMITLDFVSPNNLVFLFYHGLLVQQGQGMYDKDGNVLVSNDKAVRAAQLVYDMVSIDKIAHTKVENRTPGWYSAVQDGTIITIPGAAWLQYSIETNTMGLDGKWRVMKMPAFEKGGSRATNIGGSVFVIPSQTKSPELAWKFVEFISLTVEGQIAMYKGAGPFPTLIEAYNDPYFDEPDPYLGGQKVRRMWAEIAQEVPEFYYMPTTREDWDILNAYLIKICNNEMGIQEGLDKAAEDIQKGLIAEGFDSKIIK